MKQILVVDDDLNILKLIDIRPETEGYQVFAAKTPDQAATIIQQF